jgi:hypothetical protein
MQKNSIISNINYYHGFVRLLLQLRQRMNLIHQLMSAKKIIENHYKIKINFRTLYKSQCTPADDKQTQNVTAGTH